ncbi:MAG: hypothetical protein ACM3PP_05435 [Candidatus Saccharibacteria bacterium]
MRELLDPRSEGMAMVKSALRFLQVDVTEKTTVQELDEIYKNVIAYVTDLVLAKIANLDERIHY